MAIQQFSWLTPFIRAEGSLRMNGYEFFNELLTRLENVQKEVNRIRDLIKKRVQELRCT